VTHESFLFTEEYSANHDAMHHFPWQLLVLMSGGLGLAGLAAGTALADKTPQQ